MSRLEIPLQFRKLWATGDVLLWAELDLELKDNSGQWKTETFRVDPGTEMTTMPASLAKQLDLPMPRKAAPGAIHKQTGLAIRAGLLRARIVGLGGRDFTFPRFFLGDPDTPPSLSQAVTPALKLLGLSGVVDKVRIIFDGTRTQSAPYGNLILETL
jgi:hypothetical protein